MGPLAALERFLERLFERPAARLPGARLEPVTIVRRLERAIDQERRAGPDGLVTPTRLTVAVCPSDAAALAALGGLEADLAEAALAHARRRGYRIPERPTVAVVGEILAIRSELFEAFPDRVVCDDVYLCMRMLAMRRRVVFVPEAVSVESASATLADEFARRRKIASARWQLLFHPQWWPWRNSLAMFELVSHKLLRLPVPFLLAAAFLLALAAVLRGGGPLIAACLAAQAFAYLVAIVGLLGRAASRLPGASAAAYFVVGNLANAVGLLDFARGRVTPLWNRVRRSDMPSPG